jgi:murein DD-endopeptidase MepM/ murein hydrolase activator NlpD
MALPLLLGAAKGLIGSGKKKPKSGKEVAGKIVQRKEKQDAEKPSAQKKLAPAQVSSTKFFKGGSSTPKIKTLKPNTGNSQLDNVLESIQSSISKLTRTIKNFIKFKRKDNQAKTQRKNKMLARLREVGFGMIGGVLSLGKKLLSKIPFFDRIKNFFVNILLGGIILMILDNIKPIIETIKYVVEEVKKLFELLNKYLFQPLLEAGKFLIDTVLPIINDILKSPPVDFVKTQIENLIKTLQDNFPGLENISNTVQNALNQIQGVVTGGSNNVSTNTDSSQYDTSSGGLLASGGIERGAKAKEQVSQAGFGESEFTLYRDTVAQIESGGKYDIQGGSKDEFGVGMYAGRYQMGATAREDAARLLGETYQGDSEAARKTFREDKQMQERYFAAYTRANHQYLMNRSPEYKELPKEEKLQVLGYAHNLGWRSAAEWLSRGRTNSGADGAGTKSDTFANNIRKAQQQRRQSVPIPPSLRSGSIPSQADLPPLPPTGTGGASLAAAQQYGASRDDGNRRHAGQDFDAGPNGTFYSRIGGEVIYAANAGGGYGNVVDVYNKELGVTERVAEGDTNLVKAGDIIAAGTPLQKGTRQTGVFHYEIRKGKATNSSSFAGTVDPIQYLKSLSSRASSQPQVSAPQITAPSERQTAEEISRQTDYERMRTIFMPIAVPTEGGGNTSSGGGPPAIIGGGSSRDTYLQIMMENKLYKG